MRQPAQEEIAQRAYEFYLARGCQPGLDVDDWLAADKELSSDGVLSELRIDVTPESESERSVPERVKSFAAAKSA